MWCDTMVDRGGGYILLSRHRQVHCHELPATTLIVAVGRLLDMVGGESFFIKVFYMINMYNL